MKSPEYVRDVTRIWRRLIDENRGASDDEMRALAAIFSRQGFTDGYFVSKIDSRMLGVRKEENKEDSRNLQKSDKFEKIERKIPVDMSFSMREGEPITLNITCASHGVSAEVRGDVPEIAHTRPLDAESVKKSISKLGATAFCADKIDVNIEGELMLPISSLNALRRDAVAALEASINASYAARSEADLKRVAPREAVEASKPRTSAFFADPDSVTELAKEYFDIIYLPLEKYDGGANGISMPPVVFDSERAEVERMLAHAKECGAEHILVQNIAQFELAKKYGFEMHASLRLNVCNGESVRQVLGLGAADVIVSPELTLAQLRDMPRGTSVCAYGRIPLMVTEKCVSREIADCAACESGRAELVDRRNIRFPVLRAYKHRSEIYNSVPIYMADRSRELPSESKMGRHFIFSTESAREVDSVIRAYERMSPPSDSSKVRRIK